MRGERRRESERDYYTCNDIFTLINSELLWYIRITAVLYTANLCVPKFSRTDVLGVYRNEGTYLTSEWHGKHVGHCLTNQ
jgi:hypothetical protein